jgi:recombinational DNA repair ATPase RecF
MSEGGGEEAVHEGSAATASPLPLKIDSLSLRAYRAFSAEIEIPVHGRNLVVYGENGAGKSSIYKALRTCSRAGLTATRSKTTSTSIHSTPR